MRPLRWIWRLINNHIDNDLHNHAAEMAYFSMMAVFPFFFLLTTAVAFLPVPSLFEETMHLVRQVAPGDVVELLEDTVFEVTSVPRADLLVITLLICGWLSAGAMSSVTRGLNKAFGLKDDRHYVHFFGLSIILTAMLGLLLIVAIVLIMVGPVLQSRLLPDIGPAGELAVATFRYVIAGFFLLIAHAGVYWLCPAVRRDFRLFTPGSLFAVAAWVLVSWGLQTYLRHFNNYGKIYGSLGAVILTLLWFYMMSFVLLLGGQIDAIRHPEYKVRVREDGTPVEQPFPVRFALVALALLILVPSLLIFLAPKGWYTRSAEKIGGDLRVAIERSVNDGTEAFDHAAWDALLRKYVDDAGAVDYAAWHKKRKGLDAYLTSLALVDISLLSKRELHAFLINLYNAATVQLILDHWEQKIERIKDIEEPWKIEFVKLQGETVTLDEIEHNMIRPFFKDPRDHFALNCAAKGCPKLRREAYTGPQLDAQLDDATRSALKNIRIDTEKPALHLPKIIDFYLKDFWIDDTRTLTPFLMKWVPEEAKAILRERGDDAIRFLPYDWHLNAR